MIRTGFAILVGVIFVTGAAAQAQTSAQTSTLHSGFQASSDDERQCSFIDDSDAGVVNAEGCENVPSLPLDVLAVIECNARPQLNLEAAEVAQFEDDVQVGTHVAAGAAGFTAFGIRSINNQSSHKDLMG